MRQTSLERRQPCDKDYGGSERATLSLGIWALRPAHAWGFLSAILGVPLIVLVAVVYAVQVTRGEDAGAAGVLAALWASLLEDPESRFLLWTAVALAPVAAVVFAAQLRAALQVTPTGLHAYVPRGLGLGLFRQTTGRWDIRWQDVRRARLVCPEAPNGRLPRLGWYQLVIETAQREIRLNPFTWFDRDGPDHRLGLEEIFTLRGHNAVARIEKAPVMRALRARSIEIEIESVADDADRRSPSFDLARHRGMLVQLVLLFSAGLYAVGDTFLVVGPVPLGPLPVLPFALTAALGALAVSALGRGAPAKERVCVGVLTLAALVAAVWPATLRYNAATAEPQIVTYVSSGHGRFEAREGGLPAIDLSGHDIDEYLAQYPPGAEHEFKLLRGAAEVYALDPAPLYARTRAFYEERSRDGGEGRAD